MPPITKYNFLPDAPCRVPGDKRTRRRIQWDLDEAKRLRAEDPKTWTFKALAKRYGVTPPAVYWGFYPGRRASTTSLGGKAHSRYEEEPNESA